VERWQQIESLFQEALQRDPAERDAYVRESCRGDSDLRREVVSLLANYREASDFKPWAAAAAAELIAGRTSLQPGHNPVRWVKFLAEDNLQFQTLSEDAERALLACCPSYLQDMVVFALNTGLRSGDIFNLKWEEVDLEQSRLNVLVQKTRKLLAIPLNDAAYGILGAWQGMRKGPYVFYNQMTGDRFRDLKAGFKLACKQAGIDGVTWHTLRHTFASRLVRNGADIVTVKELLGHSTIVVTMRYAHTNDETKTRAIKNVGSSDRVVTVMPKPRRTKQ
jgi:integrase